MPTTPSSKRWTKRKFLWFCSTAAFFRSRNAATTIWWASTTGAPATSRQSISSGKAAAAFSSSQMSVLLPRWKPAWLVFGRPCSRMASRWTGAFVQSLPSVENSALQKMLNKFRPEGFVCVNDRTAGRLMQSLLALGHRIPQDFKIVGINGSRRKRKTFTCAAHHDSSALPGNRPCRHGRYVRAHQTSGYDAPRYLARRRTGDSLFLRKPGGDQQLTAHS